MMLDGYIRTTADQGDDRAVQDVMSLYGIPLVKETTANTLVVGSELLPDRVVTSLAWQGKTWQETHEIVIFHAQDQAAPGRVVNPASLNRRQYFTRRAGQICQQAAFFF